MCVYYQYAHFATMHKSLKKWLIAGQFVKLAILPIWIANRVDALRLLRPAIGCCDTLNMANYISQPRDRQTLVHHLHTRPLRLSLCPRFQQPFHTHVCVYYGWVRGPYLYNGKTEPCAKEPVLSRSDRQLHKKPETGVILSRYLRLH